MAFKKTDIIKLSEKKELFDKAAEWFHSKWGIPKEAYLESMQSSLTSESGVPEWYIITDNGGNIAGGLGVIENDFHKRPDLTPNICAVYVEAEYRKQGVARMLLDNACEELSSHGINTAYLLTSHTDFYEHCGWKFYTMVEEDGGGTDRMYIRSASTASCLRRTQ